MYSQMFRRIGAANTLGKGFISFLYRILHQLLQGISCLDNWEQKQMAVRLIFHTIQLFTTTMRDGWQFLLRKPAESRFAAIKTSACHHSRLVFLSAYRHHITLPTQSGSSKCFLMSSSIFISRKREFLFRLHKNSNKCIQRLSSRHCSVCRQIQVCMSA